MKREITSFLLHLSICLGLLLVSFTGYLFVRRLIERRFVTCDKSLNLMCQLSGLEMENGKLKLMGWVFQLGCDSSDAQYDVILYDAERGKGKYTQVIKTESEEVNEYFSCEYDYSEAGFEAVIAERKIDIRNTDYEILFRLKNTKNAYRSGYYLINGELEHRPAIDENPVMAEGELLKRVVSEGLLLVYDQCGIHVYQYGQKLYWVADTSYPYFEEGQRCIFFHLNTTQKHCLPEYRRIYGFDNLDFDFESYEILDIGETAYRVAARKLPDGYAITSMSTGDYNPATGENAWVAESIFPWLEVGVLN